MTPTPSTLSPTIFKAYDIRGIVDDTLTEAACYAVGRALAVRCTTLNITRCVVGRDGRLSGIRLANAVSQGLMAGGINVTDIGLCTTPVVYWATHHLNTGTGVMITGSHNPPQYNGLKMMLDGDALCGDDIQALYTVAHTFMPEAIAATTSHATPTHTATLALMDLIPAYTARVVGDTQLQSPMKVVMDCGNGAAGAVAPALIKALGVEVIELYSEVDGTFPNHHPDPAHVENLHDLIKTLQASDADIGIAFDGDGDRLGVVTRSGEVIFPDRQLMLFAADVLSRNPGAPIVYDVKCSRLVGDTITQNGGEAVMWKTGHSLIKAKMKALNAPLAGEMSGHIFFKERWYGFDDGVYAAVRLLEILAREKKRGRSSSDVLDSLPNSSATPEINIACAEGEAHTLCAKLQQTGTFEQANAVHTIDGVRAEWIDGFGLARASNTTPVIVLRFEADNAAALSRIQAVFSRELRALKTDIVLPF
jgi:phosphomannomutase / phosphoglucomutase